VLKARDKLSRARPTLAAASQILLHSPDTMASIAARTFLLMRRGGMLSAAAAGWSRTASARLAGIGGMMFSMIGTIGACPVAATHRNVTFCLAARYWPN
jgi:hypothetical protein